MVKVTGTLVQSYYICPRQTWFMAHNLLPDQENTYIELGRLIDEAVYERDRKRIHLDSMVIDLVRTADEDLLVGEIKKSSKAKMSAKMQLVFYLYRLKEMGISARGVLLFPKEKRKEEVILTPENEREIREVISRIEEIASKEVPPPFKKIKFCSKCGYREFCLS